MSKFQVGDIVRCIDSGTYTADDLVKGNIYRVNCVGNGVDGQWCVGFANKLQWFAARFELVEPNVMEDSAAEYDDILQGQEIYSKLVDG